MKNDYLQFVVGKYPAYKDSGVKWIGEIPVGWVLTRLGTRFLERRTKVSDKTYPPLSVTKNGILPQLETAAKTNDGDNRKLVKKGDFVINSRSDRKGSSGISFQDGSVSLINIVITPEGIHPTYCNYLLKGYAFIEEFYRMGHGIVADLWTTRYDEMKNIKITLPPLFQQTAIANFLDEKCGKIDRAVEQKEKMVELLKERKQIVIQALVSGKWLIVNDGTGKSVIARPDGEGVYRVGGKAVVRDNGQLLIMNGELTPDQTKLIVKAKNSDVEWIGEIPTHWDVIRVGYMINLTTGFPFSSSGFSQNKEDTRLLRGVNVTPSGIRWDSVVYWKRTIDDGLDNFELYEGDIVFGMDRPTISSGVRASKIGPNDTQSLLVQRVAQLRPNSKVISDFLMLLISSQMFEDYMAPIFTGVSIPHLSPDQICKYKVALPHVNEQELIIEYIEKESAKIDKAITLQQKQIEKLKEYKATLINSAVTGKIRVSGVEV